MGIGCPPPSRDTKDIFSIFPVMQSIEGHVIDVFACVMFCVTLFPDNRTQTVPIHRHDDCCYKALLVHISVMSEKEKKKKKR